MTNVRPVPHDGDRDTPNEITCAWCGEPIAFDRQEVYVHGHSYVCYMHAHRDCRTCKYAVRNPAAHNLLCQHPSLPCMKYPASEAANGVPGVSAAAVSGREAGLGWRPDPVPCAGYKLWEIHPRWLKKETEPCK